MPRSGRSTENGSRLRSDRNYRIALQINTLIGTSFQIRTSPRDNVETVKRRIGIQESLDPVHQHLVFRTRELLDHEIVEEVGLKNNSALTLVMTLRGGPVTSKTKNNLLVASTFARKHQQQTSQNSKRAEREEEPMEDHKFDIVLIKCDGTIYIYDIEETTMAVEEPMLDDTDDDCSTEEEFSDSDDDSGASSLNARSKQLMTKQQILENRKTYVQMNTVQKNLAKKRHQKRVQLMTKQSASLATARRRIPSPRKPHLVAPPAIAGLQELQRPDATTSVNPFQSSPKSTCYLQAVRTISLLRAEMILRARELQFHPGVSPYTNSQLERYLKAKLLILLEDEGFERSFIPKAFSLTPTCHVKELTYPDSSSSDDDDFGEIRLRPNFVHFRESPAGSEDDEEDQLMDEIINIKNYEINKINSEEKSESQGQSSKYADLFEIDFRNSDDLDKLEIIDEGVWSALEDSDVEELKQLWTEEAKTYRPKHANNSTNHQWPLGSDVVQGGEQGGQIPDVPVESITEQDSPRSETEDIEDLEEIEDIIQEEEEKLIGHSSAPGLSAATNNDPTFDKINKDKEIKAKASLSNVVVIAAATVAAKVATTAKRCGQCNKKLTIVNQYECRCGQYFCSKHRHAEVHKCTFDYKEEGRRLIEKANPVITAPKLPHI